MGDHDQRAAPLQQVLGQPGDAGHVEMVRRLVEHQQVGGADQQRGQRDPPALAAGHRCRPGVQAEVAACRVRRGPSRTPESPAHSCSAANAGRQPRRAEHHVAHGRSGARSSDCGSDSTRRSRRWVTRPLSGSSACVSIRSSVDLPAPLRPTTPTRSLSSSPIETSRQQRAGRAVRLRYPVEVDDVRHQSTRRAGRPDRSRPACHAAHARRGQHGGRDAAACAGVATRGRGRSARSRRSSRPALRRPYPRPSVWASSGRSVSAAACMSLPSAAARTSGSLLPQRGHQIVGRAERRRREQRRALPVDLAVDLGRGQSVVGDRDHPVPRHRRGPAPG